MSKTTRKPQLASTENSNETKEVSRRNEFTGTAVKDIHRIDGRH